MNRPAVVIEPRRPLARREVMRLVEYCPETGVFTWKPRAREDCPSFCAWRSWNAKHAGKPAFTMRNAQGYLVGRIMGHRLKAHTVAWLIVTGKNPPLLDHIDGDRSNNRFANLREATRAENSRNAFMRKDNTSGYAGVHLHRKTGKWRAHIHANGQLIHLGLFEKIEAAAAARQSALIAYGFSERHGERRT